MLSAGGMGGAKQTGWGGLQARLAILSHLQPHPFKVQHAALDSGPWVARQNTPDSQTVSAAKSDLIGGHGGPPHGRLRWNLTHPQLYCAVASGGLWVA